MAVANAIVELGGSYTTVAITVHLSRRGSGRLMFTSALPAESLAIATHAINTAARLESYARFDLAKLQEGDVTVSTSIREPLVGPSFGLALAAAFLAELSRKTIPGDIAFTGEVLPDGRIGAVGDIQLKLAACGRLGYNALVLPSSQIDFMCTHCRQICVGDLFQLYARAIDEN